MILECLNGQPIKIDGEPFMKNLRLNIPKDKKALRMNMEFIQPDGEIPIDIMVYSYSTPRLYKVSSIVITLDGRELVHNVPFIVDLHFNLLTRKWKVVGRFNNKPINKNMDSVMDILPILVAQLDRKQKTQIKTSKTK